MSWGIQYRTEPGEDAAARYWDTVEQYILTNRQYNPDFGDEPAFVHAVQAAGKSVELLVPAAGGSDSYGFVVEVSGHTNPGNSPRAGWVNDNTKIIISQRDRKP